MVVGQGAAGKTSTVRSLLGLPPESRHLTTVGADLSVTNTVDWKKTKAGENELARMQARAAAARMEKKHVSLPKKVQKAAAQMVARARESLVVIESSCTSETQ